MRLEILQRLRVTYTFTTRTMIAPFFRRYKQKGEAALESHNVFHHLFYEGEVDIYSIKDPLKRNATIGFINNFGQVSCSKHQLIYIVEKWLKYYF